MPTIGTPRHTMTHHGTPWAMMAHHGTPPPSRPVADVIEGNIVHPPGLAAPHQPEAGPALLPGLPGHGGVKANYHTAVHCGPQTLTMILSIWSIRGD